MRSNIVAPGHGVIRIKLRRYVVYIHLI